MSDPLAKRRRGLPGERSMRHDQHFVENLTVRDTTPVGRQIALSSVRADPAQPRHDMGDLSDLVASIRDKGILEPVLVRPEPVEGGAESFILISGERRYRAALEAGLFEIPAIEMDVSEQEALEIALVENLQRQDLTPFEEAEGYEALASNHGYTHAQVSEAVSRSRTSVTESLALLKIPQSVREPALTAGINTKSVLLEILKLKDEAAMLEMVERISQFGMSREAVRREVSENRKRRTPGTRAKPYTFRFRPDSKKYRLELSFRQSTVEPTDLIEALEHTLAELRRREAEADSSLLLD